jgi:hypothetical protein
MAKKTKMTRKKSKTKKDGLHLGEFLTERYKRRPFRAVGVDYGDPKHGCGCERAGIGIFNDNCEIQRCDECDLFESDHDASRAVDHLLMLLHREYAAHSREDESTVADAMDRLVFLQKHGRRPGPGEA